MEKKFDFNLFSLLLILATFSLINLFGIDHLVFRSQFYFYLIGFVFFFIFYFLGLDFFKYNSKLFYIFSIFLVVLTYFVGEDVRGSRRWINFYFFNYQGSEFLKVFFIIYLSDFLVSTKNYFTDEYIYFSKFLKSFIIFLIPVFVVYKQPDLGSALVLFSVYFSLFYFSGLKIKYYIFGSVFFVLSSPLIWGHLKDYQKNRVLSFINPNFDPAGISYNVIQSIITVGSGSFFGKGLGFGTQSKLDFLPENHTDFVFASFIEQFGFFGGFILLCIYGLIIGILLKKILSNKDDFFKVLFLIGLLTVFLFQIFINIGMNIGIMPVTGITLPFMSYGGSSVVAFLMLFGLAVRL